MHHMYSNFDYYPPPHSRRKQEYKGSPSLSSLKNIFSLCGDFESRNIDFGLEGGQFLSVCWLDGIVAGVTVAEDVIRPLTESVRAKKVETLQDCYERIFNGSVYSYSVQERKDLDSLVSDLSHGRCAILFDGLNAALTFDVRSPVSRSISEPTLEKSIKGSKDSFVEVLRINTSLVRRRICSPRLKLIESSIGRRSNTRVSVMFLDGVASPETVDELSRRLDALDVDALLATGTLEEYIVDAPLSPFPQLIHTERPDRFAMYLMEGRVGILVDGLPLGIVVPVTLAEFMKVTSDSNMHFMVATALTILRYTALMLGLLLPALYVAVAMYHQEMIPTQLLLSIISAKENVPFSTAIELISMMIAFSLLQEASLRLPSPIGDTVSIIGALIVGQSAVEAQLVSPIAIIVVAVSGIACYTLPSQDLGSAVRLVRWALLLCAIGAGLYGVGIFSCAVLLLLSNMDSFGVNYTAPLSGDEKWGLYKLLIRRPKSNEKFRDPLLHTPDRRRQK